MENEAQEYADVIADELRELEAALEALLDEDAEAADFDGVTFTDAMDVLHHYWNFCALSVEDVTNVTYGDHARRERRYVEVARTVGGPGCYVRFYGNGNASVRAYWGTSRGRTDVHVPYADTELQEWMDALAGAWS